MIKVSVMYPHTPGGRFDHGYYRQHHLPMIETLMGDRLVAWSIDKGLDGGRPGTPPTYEAMCHLFCESMEAFQAGFGPHARQIMADVSNYTDLTPVMQVSEVVAPAARAGVPS